MFSTLSVGSGQNNCDTYEDVDCVHIDPDGTVNKINKLAKKKRKKKKKNFTKQ